MTWRHYTRKSSLKKTGKHPPALLILTGLCVLFFSLTVYHICDYVGQTKLVVQQAKDSTRRNMTRIIQKMDNHFAKVMRIANQYVVELENHQYSPSKIQQIEYEVLRQNPEVFGFCIAYEPYQYAPGKRLFAPYAFRNNNGSISRKQVEDDYDYTQKNSAGLTWYVNPMKNGAGWTEPYFGPAADSYMIDYAAPFYGSITGGKKPKGIVTIDYSLGEIKQLTQSLGLEGNRYAFIVSQNGVYISHPNEEYVEGRRNLLDEPGLGKNQRIQAQIKKALAGESQLIEFKNQVTGQDSWLFLEPLPASKYVMGAIYIQSAVTNHKDYTRRKLIQISLLLLTGMFLLLVILLRGYELSSRSLWLMGVAFTVLLIVEIITIWYLTVKYNNYYRPNTIKIVDNSVLNHFMNAQREKSKKLHEAPPVFIRTGVFVQSLDFVSANNVKMTGYIWQKFDKSVPKDKDQDIDEGIIFPESVDETIEEAYRREVKGVLTIGWHFEVELRQSFEYDKYPFDNKDVWIRIWPKDFDENVILIPDLQTYTSIDPATLPGVENDFVLTGWHILQSFFSFVPNSYNTNFGIDSYMGQEDFPELYYSVIIEREFLNPFIANLLPFTVIAFILFGTLLLLSFAEDKSEKFQSSIGGTLAGCAGLFFSVIIAHIQLRNEINTDRVLYMEYFYFVLYAAILLVVIDAFLVAFESKLTLIRFRDNL
ncbi:MAG TPA: cache domain-containing protein, partial [Bacillota bacterium]|nr:cache domain-containing protein [Bacillota bacterium]